MDSETRQIVRARAMDRCEYCRVPQGSAPFLTFHVEHIVAQQHLLDDSVDNLALACPACNRHKGPNIASIDPIRRELTILFNPRVHRWEDHFRFEGASILGRTLLGEVTARLLQFNSEERVKIRAEMMRNGDYS